MASKTNEQHGLGLLLSGGAGWNTIDGAIDGAVVRSTQMAHLDRRRYIVETRWGRCAGRLEPISVAVHRGDDGGGVTADAIRRLPIGTMHKQQRAAAAANAAALNRKHPGWEPPAWTDMVRKMAAAQSDIGGHRGTPISDAELEQVAAVYLAAWGVGLPVTEAVADHFTVSKSTASKRIMKARAAGLLDQAQRITR